jgi:hypothetical protein
MLDRRVNGRWHWINRRQGFTLPLFYLEAGEKGEPESLAVYLGSPDPVELSPGHYRVTKGVQLTAREAAATNHEPPSKLPHRSLDQSCGYLLLGSQGLRLCGLCALCERREQPPGQPVNSGGSSGRAAFYAAA